MHLAPCIALDTIASHTTAGLKIMALAGYNPSKGPEAFRLLASALNGSCVHRPSCATCRACVTCAYVPTPPLVHLLLLLLRCWRTARLAGVSGDSKRTGAETLMAGLGCTHPDSNRCVPVCADACTPACVPVRLCAQAARLRQHKAVCR
jgi:hypothetical protein